MTALGTFIFAAGVLLSIGIHEVGHFATAKWFGMKVHQFFIGFGPRIWSVRRGETEYGVRALPFGGFVKIAGMTPFEEIPAEDAGRVYAAKPAWQRAIVVGAGSFTHFVLALGIIAAVLATTGSTDLDRPTQTISGVSETHEGKASPAALAEPVDAGVPRGILAGDRLVAVDGEEVASWGDAVERLRARPGERVTVTVERAGRRIDFDAKLSAVRPDGTRAGFLGIAPEFAVKEFGPIAALGESGKQIGSGIWQSLVAFKNIFSPSTLGRLFSVAAGTEERTIDDPTTVVGISGFAGGLARRGDYAGLALLIASVNIFIGVVNLLPLPPLDGGHLAVVGYEKVTRTRVDMRRLLPVTATVISVFASLFLLLLYLDIVRPLPPLPG